MSLRAPRPDYRIASDGPDSLVGTPGHDSLDGGLGEDTLEGLEGNDTLVGGEGNDLAYGYAGYDSLAGGAGDDTLMGVDGADTVVGGDGNDWLFADTSLVRGVKDAAGTLNLLYGGNGADNVFGGAGNDRLWGQTDDDVLQGREGDDTLDGGGGLDTASYSEAKVAVTVSLLVAGVQATGGAGNDVLVGIENLAGGDQGDWLTGNASANALAGGAGNDTLNGVAGADTLDGGLGDDSYFIDSSGDSVVESADAGVDLVNSFLASTVLGAELENLRLLSTGTANGSGNALDNTLFAGAGDNALNGGTGSDTVSYLHAGGGVTVNLALTASQATGGSGNDALANFDHLTGSHHADTLRGNALANRIDGGIGADWLLGGGGEDTMVGGAGADLFVYSAVGESTALLRDTITDFSHAQADRIDLSRIDADAVLAGNQAFVFIGAAAFSANATGQVRYADGVLYASVDADAEAEFAITLAGSPALVAADFIV